MLAAVLLAGCMSEGERINQIQTAEAMVNLGRLRVQQLRASRDSAMLRRKPDTAYLRVIDENIRSADSALIGYQLQLRKLYK